MTSLRRVGWWNQVERNTGQCSLIGDELSKLVEGPRVRSPPLFFRAWLQIGALSDAGQVLQGEGRLADDGRIDDRTTDRVVVPG